MPYNFLMVSLWVPLWSHMVSLWLPYGFPYGFRMASLWLPYGIPIMFLLLFYGFAMVVLWVSYGLRSPYGFPMASLGFLIISPWLPHGFLMWVPYGFPPAFL
jgi:hypothetical protein